MQCPYCHKDMLPGHIQTRGEVIKWLPADKNVSFLATRYEVKKHELKLGSYNWFVGGNVEAYYCEECQKILIDLKVE